MSSKQKVYCTLTAQEQRARRSLVRAIIIPHITAVHSLTNSLRVEFDAFSGLRESLQEFIILEQECCGFLNITLSQQPNELSLLIEGPPEAAAVIELFRQAVQESGQ